MDTEVLRSLLMKKRNSGEGMDLSKFKALMEEGDDEKKVSDLAPAGVEAIDESEKMPSGEMVENETISPEGMGEESTEGMDEKAIEALLSEGAEEMEGRKPQSLMDRIKLNILAKRKNGV